MSAENKTPPRLWRDYYVVHKQAQFDERESFHGPFMKREDAEKYCDKMRFCGGEWRSSGIVKIRIINVYPYPAEYEGITIEDKLGLSYGFLYNGVYYGPFKDKYNATKAIMDGENAVHICNTATMFEMVLQQP